MKTLHHDNDHDNDDDDDEDDESGVLEKNPSSPSGNDHMTFRLLVRILFIATIATVLHFDYFISSSKYSNVAPAWSSRYAFFFVIPE